MGEIDYKDIPLQPMFDKHIHLIYDCIESHTGAVTFTCMHKAFEWIKESYLSQEDKDTAINVLSQVFNGEIQTATLLPDNYDKILEKLKSHKVENAIYSRVAELKMCDDTKVKLAEWIRNQRSFYLMLLNL